MIRRVLFIAAILALSSVARSQSGTFGEFEQGFFGDGSPHQLYVGGLRLGYSPWVWTRAHMPSSRRLGIDLIIGGYFSNPGIALSGSVAVHQFLFSTQSANLPLTDLISIHTFGELGVLYGKKESAIARTGFGSLGLEVGAAGAFLYVAPTLFFKTFWEDRITSRWGLTGGIRVYF